jgi:uncharacterized protein YceK
MRRLAGAALVAVAVCFAPGCGTLINLCPCDDPSGFPHPASIYGGTRCDLKFAQVFTTQAAEERPPGWRVSWATGVCMVAIDLPLSIAADTVLLPITIPCELARLSTNSATDLYEPTDQTSEWRRFWMVDEPPQATLGEPSAK